MQRKEEQSQGDQPALETKAAETNSLRKKHLMISAKIAAQGDVPSKEKK